MAQRRQAHRRGRRSSHRVRRTPSSSAAGARAEAKQSMGSDGGLMIGGVHDPAEKQADRMADRVMRMPSPGPMVHRKCESCEEGDNKVSRMAADTEEEETVQAKAAPGPAIAPGASAAPASPGAAGAIKCMGSGKPLAKADRAFFEPRFGADLSGVRVHDGAPADKASKGINARAFTHGNDVAFAKGEYQPGTETGRHLMAHELSHVLEGNADVRRSSGDGCGATDETCTSGEACLASDPGREGDGNQSRSWTMLVKVDIEASSFESALRNQEVGHTHIVLTESNGRAYSFGFYPRSDIPNEIVQHTPGCIRHPDTSHDACVDETLRYQLTQQQYQDVLTFAQGQCNNPPRYGVTRTCVTFARDAVGAAGESIPQALNKPFELYFNRIPPIDNPNSLHENIEEARRNDPDLVGPLWNNPCLNRAEANFERCLEGDPEHSRVSGPSAAAYCIIDRQNAFLACANQGGAQAPVETEAASDAVQRSTKGGNLMNQDDY